MSTSGMPEAVVRRLNNKDKAAKVLRNLQKAIELAQTYNTDGAPYSAVRVMREACAKAILKVEDIKP